MQLWIVVSFVLPTEVRLALPVNSFSLVKRPLILVFAGDGHREAEAGEVGGAVVAGLGSRSEHLDEVFLSSLATWPTTGAETPSTVTVPA